MDKAIKATVTSFIAPMIDLIEQQAIAEMRVRQAQKGGIPQPDAVFKQQADQMGKELEKFIIGEEEIDRMEKGFERVLEELERFPNKDAILSEIRQAAERMVPEPSDSDELDIPIYQTIQEMLGLSEETYQTMYRIGSEFFNEGKMEEALDVFVFLTTLNNFIFEPWLGLGSCRLHFDQYPEALHALSMATLLNFQHPAPHIYAAECYLAIEAKTLAKETLDLALSKMDDQQKKAFKPHIDYLNANLKKSGGKKS